MGVADGENVTGPSVLHHEADVPRAREREQARERAEAPACFGDLHLDQVIATITKGRDAYRLRPFFHVPLADADAVAYRHEVFRDLADEALRAHVEAFAGAMRSLRECSAQAGVLRDANQRRRLRLDAASTYCTAVTRLARALHHAELHSRGLRRLASYLRVYVASDPFTALQAETARIGRQLDAVRYDLTLYPDRVAVRKGTDGADDGAGVGRTFARFAEQPTAPRAAAVPPSFAMNMVESAILERLTRLYPEVFVDLETFAERHGDYLDPTVTAFDREVQFYLAYLDYMARFEDAGLGFCFPAVSSDKAVRVTGAFDAALAHALLEEGGMVVCNDFHLSGEERIFLVTGANQGGKTTFARMVGQVHFLASLGCPVPASRAEVCLFDELLTHFEKVEDLDLLRGKLQDELLRLHELLERATPRSILIVNEVFASTTADDARYLGRRVLNRLLKLGLVGVWVTFVEELASFDPRIVSVVSTVDPANALRRTFKLLRRPADGHAHALAIAKAHRLTYDELRSRLRS